MIYYEGIKVGRKRPDFIIDDGVVVELKAVIELAYAHVAQAKDYVVACDLDITAC